MAKQIERVNNMSKVITDKRPCFFKLILPGFTTEHLRIPPHFIKHIAKNASDRAILKLRGPSGGHWPVKLCKNKRGIFLQDGWQVFLKAHSLGNYEFLLFTYDGKMCFEVRIFDKSGLERVSVSINDTNQEDAESERVDNPGDGPFKRRGRPRKDSVGSVRHPQPPSPAYNQDDEDLRVCKSSKLKKPRNGECSDQVKIKRKEIIEMSDHEETNCRFKKSKDEKINQSKILKDGRAESLNSTNFQKLLASYNVQKPFILSIPAAFAKRNLPRIKTKVTLRNAGGKSWVVNFIPNEGNNAFSGGWLAFVRDNNLKLGDLCKFELVGKTEMHVHVSRS